METEKIFVDREHVRDVYITMLSQRLLIFVQKFKQDKNSVNILILVTVINRFTQRYYTNAI